MHCGSEKGLKPVSNPLCTTEKSICDRDHTALAKRSVIVFLTSYFICKSNPELKLSNFNVVTLHISLK